MPPRKDTKLNPYELNTLLPRLIKGFQNRVGERSAITSTEIIQVLKTEGYKVDDATIRALVRHIRQQHLIPGLASSSKGYWVETDPNVLKNCITRLRARAKDQLASAEALAQDYYRMTQQTLPE